ncbi:hypothetical protein [Seonamhaeicola sp.]|uniref:hypothetical protein n=1 Tax=Seonamhaeicola sp. TaxID=1912245 RepID=UPI0026145E84|nr:hypothetical protein [Seonamhaeicola sp.]
MRFKLFIVAVTISLYSVSQNKIPEKAWQIHTAVLGLEAPFREGAKVYGYDAEGHFVVLREGTNQYICLADDPNKDGFQVAAYHKDLDPFMARGRELKMQGKNFKEIFDIREEEVKSGRLKIPYNTTLIVLRGEVNQETHEIEKQRVRYVVYIPYATAETTGLPEKPLTKGHPWIMNPGTHRAHIMITPAYPELDQKK